MKVVCSGAKKCGASNCSHYTVHEEDMSCKLLLQCSILGGVRCIPVDEKKEESK